MSRTFEKQSLMFNYAAVGVAGQFEMQFLAVAAAIKSNLIDVQYLVSGTTNICMCHINRGAINCNI